MNTNITRHPSYSVQMRAGLLEVPSVCLTTSGTVNGATEVKTAIEFLRPDGQPGFQEACGIKEFGGAFTVFEKGSFRLYFRSEYGAPKLRYPLFQGYERGLAAVDEFNQLELRSGSHDMSQRGFDLSNILTDDTLLEMGRLNPHGRFVHLYFNGTYWGLYHLRERWDAAMHQSYLGGGRTNYESINGNWNVGGWADPGSPYDGDGSVWEKTKSLRDNYTAVRPWLDVPQYVDYMLMWMFGGAWVFGNKGHMATFAEDSARRGYVGVSIDYRIRPGATDIPGGTTMGWSTSELAAMAGTTVNTIRHYHRVGLLAEPERLSNGYKQYQAWHLARLIQIRRLRELGVPLTRVEELGESPDDLTESLRVLDAELAASIERLQRARTELAAILSARAPMDVPTDFSSVAERLSEADRAVLSISTTFYDEQAMTDLKRMIEAEPTDLDHEINTLAPDADEGTRRRLAERVAEILTEHRRNHPWMKDPRARLTRSPAVVREIAMRSIADLYNEAQRDVLFRAHLLLQDPDPEA